MSKKPMHKYTSLDIAEMQINRAQIEEEQSASPKMLVLAILWAVAFYVGLFMVWLAWPIIKGVL